MAKLHKREYTVKRFHTCIFRLYKKGTLKSTIKYTWQAFLINQKLKQNHILQPVYFVVVEIGFDSKKFYSATTILHKYNGVPFLLARVIPASMFIS